MWLFSPRETRRKPRRASGFNQQARSRRTPAFRPCLEALEDRCLLSAGALDTTFGGTGIVTTLPGNKSAAADAVLVQPWDGKIVVAGDSASGKSTVMALTRYNVDGTLDSTFGSGGQEVSKIGTTWWNAAALYSSTDTTGNAKKIVEAGAGSLARFNANGSTDSSFGSRGLVSVSSTSNYITGVVIQPADGKILITGNNKVTRYNANGTLDTSFGSGGTATVPLLAASGLGGLGLQADGKIVVAGWDSASDWEVARLNSNGTLDTTFDSAGAVPGIVTISFAAGPAVQGNSLAIYPSTGPDTADYGKIEVAGTISGNPVPPGVNYNQVALARFNSDGTLDPTFGQSGQVVTPFPNSGGMAWASAIQADGKIVVAGQTLSSGNWSFSLLRYNTNGSLDTTFSNSTGSQVFPNGGLVVTPSGVKAYGVAIQPDGRIVAAGSSANSSFMTARYLAGPEIGTFTASASSVMNGSSLTLTASNLTDGDPGATITQVAFYAVDSSGNQYPLGTGTLSSGIWTLNYTVSLPSGSYTLFAQATDSDGIVGDSAFLTLTVQ